MDSSDPDSTTRHPDDDKAALYAMSKIVRELRGHRVAAEAQAGTMREMVVTLREHSTRIDTSCEHCAAQTPRTERAIEAMRDERTKLEATVKELQRDPRWVRLVKWIVERYIEHPIKLTIMASIILAAFGLALVGGLDLSGLLG